MMRIAFYIFSLLLACSCVAQKGSRKASPIDVFLSDTSIRTAHVGLSIYDPSTKKYLYNYNSDKYFVPASNVKIATCYAAMKYLPRILPGARYYEDDTAVYLIATGDPTFLHRDFPAQPLFDFMRSTNKSLYITTGKWKEKELGQGWSWDDYSDEYMTERNAFPVYGNTIKWVQEKMRSNSVDLEESFSIYSDPEINWKVKFEADSGLGKFKVTRDRLSNIFVITQGTEPLKEVYVPYITNGVTSSLELLIDSLRKPVKQIGDFFLSNLDQKVIQSQPLDSVLRPMMYRSDNFFAEQLLLMAAGEKAGVMSDAAIIDTVTASLQNHVVWVDGSGLSRYNLFTPRSFVEILDSMRLQFGMERIKGIFPSGDSGTLKGYYVNQHGRIYAKTGSMGGVICLSGFLYGKGNRLLIFSAMINNYNGTNSTARRAIERLLKSWL
jgi:D-alanyl-D-alanine carboxypeptidase/D-alanyl-D-alanine-endopeptidase (penicillin-binding protein 4)